jgi:hypothetical protein
MADDMETLVGDSPGIHALHLALKALDAEMAGHVEAGHGEGPGNAVERLTLAASVLFVTWMTEGQFDDAGQSVVHHYVARALRAVSQASILGEGGETLILGDGPTKQ